MTDATPEPIEPDVSEELSADAGQSNGNATGERLRAILRSVFAVILGVLLMGDVALFSLYKALEARVESQDRRLERTNNLLTDLLSSRDNATRVEEIELQVEDIDRQVSELHQLVKATRPPIEPPPEDDTTKSKK